MLHHPELDHQSINETVSYVVEIALNFDRLLTGTSKGDQF